MMCPVISGGKTYNAGLHHATIGLDPFAFPLVNILGDIQMYFIYKPFLLCTGKLEYYFFSFYYFLTFFLFDEIREFFSFIYLLI